MHKPKKLNDDLTTMVPVHPSAESTTTNESPPGGGPQSPLPTGGAVRLYPPYQARTAYGPKLRIRQCFLTQGRTKQSFKEECDINNIMARYLKTGVLEHVRQTVGQYLDVTGADFQSAQDLVAGANSMFHMLPAHIRTKFDNDAGKFLDYMENPRNAEEARELGLLPSEPPSSYPPTGAPSSVQPAASTQAAGPSATGGDTPPSTPPASTPPPKQGG